MEGTAVLPNTLPDQRFPAFSSRGTHKLTTEILWHTRNIFFADLTKKIGIILIHSHQAAIVVLAVALF